MPTFAPNQPPYVGFIASRYVVGQFLYSNGAAAGVFTHALVIPAYSLLLDIGITSLALWNQGTSAAIVVGDADDADGFIVSTDLKATDLLQYESISIRAGTALAGGKIGAYIANSQWGKGSGTYGQLSPAARVITATLTTVGTAATTGNVYVWAEYVPFGGAGESVQQATYVAS